MNTTSTPQPQQFKNQHTPGQILMTEHMLALSAAALQAEQVGPATFVKLPPGYDLREVALVSRRQLLQALLDEKGTEHVRFTSTASCPQPSQCGMAGRRGRLCSLRQSHSWLSISRQ